ncbi:MAG: hypothetical protein LBS42_09530 [Tannerella sp.]|jgi:hypothetical protein|nr:hypothetical protein [Tannerella sp.]
MNRFFIFSILAASCFQFTACSQSAPKCCDSEPTSPATQALSWKDELKAEIPLLGHRNWIVITDMAYPLQTQPGIKTIYTGEAYMDILHFVYREIENASHVKAAVYQDKELLYLNGKDVAGIDALREQMTTLFGDRRNFVLHEKLIDRLDEISRKFNVVILKSTLTIPYTSTFFELDCNYWDSAGEEALRRQIGN